MYAIIKTGGKQYKVQAGDVIQVDKIDKTLGTEFDISDILLVGGEKTHVGTPLLTGAKVTAVITKQAKTRKIFVFKKKRRHGYRKFQTHKQDFTELFIKVITSPDGKSVKSEELPKVSDMAAERVKRIEEKVAARKEAIANKTKGLDDVSEAKISKTSAAKRVAKKATKKVAKKVAKKKVTSKAAGKKKTSKKA